MALKIKPSARLRRRHILVEASKDKIEKSILEYMGVLGWANASPVFVKSSSSRSILSINRKEVDNIRASFELYKPPIKILRISGTLKGLKLTK